MHGGLEELASTCGCLKGLAKLGGGEGGLEELASTCGCLKGLAKLGGGEAYMASEEPRSSSALEWRSMMEEEMRSMRRESSMREEQMRGMQRELGDQREELSEQKQILFGFCEREILIIAGEILKWAVQKRGESDGDGLQFYDSRENVRQLVLRCCVAVGDGAVPEGATLRRFRQLTRNVIKARNATAHCLDLEALESRINGCKLAIRKWPELRQKHPDQVKVILKYSSIKRHLPESFQ